MDLQIVAWHSSKRRSKNHYKWSDMALTLCGRQVGKNIVPVSSYVTCAQCIEFNEIRLSQENLDDGTEDIVVRALLGLVSAEPWLYFIDGDGWHQERPRNLLMEDTTQ